MTRPRHGFTLFEVAISLALVAFGVISVLMLFPSGIKAQQLSRYQILATAKAVELIDVFASASNSNVMMDREGPNPWDTIGSYRAYSPDLETHVSTYRSGMYPLPLDIARRLDSDGNELQQVLDQGGYVYYSQPMATLGFNPIGTRANMPTPNESQKLICAVVGYAQQNAITTMPYKAWPYYTPYPSPPMHSINRKHSESRPTAPYSVFDSTSYRSDQTMLFEHTLDADNGEMGVVFRAVVRGQDLPLTTAWVNSADVRSHNSPMLRRSSGYWAYGDAGGWVLDWWREKYTENGQVKQRPGKWWQANPDGGKANNIAPYDVQPPTLPNGKVNPVAKDNTGAPTTNVKLARESALAYFALTKWYAQRKGVSSSILNGQQLVDNADLLKPATLFASPSSASNPALAVNAARLMAHAAMCLTRHFPPGATDDTINLGTLEILIDKRTSTTLGAPDTPVGVTPVIVGMNRAVIEAYHHNAMLLGMRFAASHPYDWGAPRPLNRALMMDFPLMQYDPFGGLTAQDSTSYAGYNYGAPARQWRILAGQPIENIGRSLSYPAQNLQSVWATNAVSSGDPRNFTLARPFSGADRCRQLVFWAVDWMAYEDFETAPSAPVDASKYPKRAPVDNRSQVKDLINGDFSDRWQFGTRNPEKALVFTEDTSLLPTGADVPILGVDNLYTDRNPALPIPDKGYAGRMVFSGMYGADRNGNGNANALSVAGDRSTGNTANKINQVFGRLDRGPLPKAVRLRAVTVARFNFYDPRLPLSIR